MFSLSVLVLAAMIKACIEPLAHKLSGQMDFNTSHVEAFFPEH